MNHCIICDTEFVPHGKQRYCTPACRQQYLDDTRKITLSNARLWDEDFMPQFMAQVKRYKNSCWVWQGPKDEHGYGRVYLECQAVCAHWILLSNDQRKLLTTRKLMACHFCDRPSCVNPNHIFIGTAKINSEDMVEKGRNKRGASLLPTRIVPVT